jgi:hypothetical protein
MLALQSLQKIRGGLTSKVAGMHSANETLNAKIAQYESDKTKSQSYIAENIKAARDAVVTKARADLASMRDAAETAEAQVEFWSSRSLLLSRIPFDADKALDSALRTRYATELPLMDAVLLELTQKNALADGNLALAWACKMAGGPVDMSRVEIPGQAEALAAIADCDAALAEAELIIAAMSGQSIDPVRKLTIARRMDPNRPTQHQSPDRQSAAS